MTEHHFGIQLNVFMYDIEMWNWTVHLSISNMLNVELLWLLSNNGPRRPHNVYTNIIW